MSRLYCIGSFVAFLLVWYVHSHWPAKPSGTTFTVKPIEAHFYLAVDAMQSGDTLMMKPDGVKRYWTNGIEINKMLSNVTFAFGGTHFCAGGDWADCDVVIVNVKDGRAAITINSDE